MRNLLLGLGLFAVSGLLPAQSVQAVLARMDQAAPSFHAMSANVVMVEFTAILTDTDTENGTLEMQRLKSGETRAIVNFPGSREIAFLGRKLTIYYPKLQEYQEVDMGKHSDVLNQYMLLGFGSSGKELAQGYAITMEGTAKVAGKDTTQLQLIPKDPKVLQRLQRVEIWVPDDSANPVQQQFYEPSGNYRKATYTNINLNPSIPGVLELKLPPGTKKQSQ